MHNAWPIFFLTYWIATWWAGVLGSWLLFRERHRWGPERLGLLYACVLIGPTILFPVIAILLEGSILPTLCRGLRRYSCDAWEEILMAQIDLLEVGFWPVSYCLVVLSFAGTAILRGTGPAR